MAESTFPDTDLPDDVGSMLRKKKFRDDLLFFLGLVAVGAVALYFFLYYSPHGQGYVAPQAAQPPVAVPEGFNYLGRTHTTISLPAGGDSVTVGANLVKLSKSGEPYRFYLIDDGQNVRDLLRGLNPVQSDASPLAYEVINDTRLADARMLLWLSGDKIVYFGASKGGWDADLLIYGLLVRYPPSGPLSG